MLRRLTFAGRFLPPRPASFGFYFILFDFFNFSSPRSKTGEVFTSRIGAFLEILDAGVVAGPGPARFLVVLWLLCSWEDQCGNAAMCGNVNVV